MNDSPYDYTLTPEARQARARADAEALARPELEPGSSPADRDAHTDRQAVAAELQTALRRYALANGVTPERALMRLALANRLYDPDVLRSLGAPKHVVKGLTIAAARARR